MLVLSQCRYVVMDEADRMVNLGFEVDLLFILDKLPSETMVGEEKGDRMEIDSAGDLAEVRKGRTRVTTLFSATMPPPVERLAKKYLKKPAVITIGEAGRAVDTVEQRVEFVSGDEKKKCVFLGLARPRPAGEVLSRLMFRPAGSGCSRSSTAGSSRRPSSFSSIRRRPRTWSRKTSRAQACVSPSPSPPPSAGANIPRLASGARRRCTRARTRSSARRR